MSAKAKTYGFIAGTANMDRPGGRQALGTIWSWLIMVGGPSTIANNVADFAATASVEAKTTEDKIVKRRILAGQVASSAVSAAFTYAAYKYLRRP